MKLFATLVALFLAGAVHANPISCNATSEGNILVIMEVPHPNHALIYRPTGETIWLQSSSDFVHRQIENFSNLETWVITPESEGTVWINGKATAQPIINGKGRYHLYIAENIETEPENTYFIECYFYLGE